jgi:hypothetical protein
MKKATIAAALSVAAAFAAFAGEQLTSLPKPLKGGRFKTPTDLVWPAKPGEADVCLWSGDRFACCSITIDDNCKPTAKYSTLGLFKATQIPPEIKAIVVEKPGLDLANGAIGIGEITSIPTAPAIAEAYYQLDGERRFSLPLANTPYAKKK